MTISAAWIRKTVKEEQLMFASDSRLSGDGRLFDSGPKILTLPRNDCVISFSGYTGDAFPMMLQLGLAIDAYDAAKGGGLVLSSLKQHALRLFDGMTQTIRSSVTPKQNASPTAEFIFGGYSWTRKSFEFWHIKYREVERRFVAASIPWVGYRERFKSVGFAYRENEKEVKKIGQIQLIGDPPQVKKARGLLAARIRENALQNDFELGMHPFQIIRDMLRTADNQETIGGAPQLVIVHQYMQSEPIGIYWPRKEGGKVFIQGRETLGYENINRYVLDPDTLEIESPYRHGPF